MPPRLTPPLPSQPFQATLAKPLSPPLPGALAAFLTLALLVGLAAATAGCRCTGPGADPSPPPSPSAAPAAAEAPAADQPADLFAHATVTGAPPPGAPSVASAIASVLAEVDKPHLGALESLALPSSLVRLRRGLPAGPLPLLPVTIHQKLRAPVLRVEYLGGRAAVQVQAKSLPLTSWFYWRGGRWLMDLADTRPLEPTWPGPADPLNRAVSLAEVASAVQGQGALSARIETSLGSIRCALHQDVAPALVAHFAGLATGARASREFEGRTLTAGWKHRRFYDGTVVYRALPGRRIEGGDPIGKGTGHAGFRIADTLDLRLRHDRPGVLGLVTLGPHSASSMFYITLTADPELDDRYLPLGLCADLDILQRASQQPAASVVIQRVEILRGSP